MIYIVMAMYAEAHPFITRFQLKKDSSHTRFQVFRSNEENICLIISGTGLIAATAAVSSICTEYGVRQEDFLLNVGVCAGIRGQQPCSKLTGHPIYSTASCEVADSRGNENIRKAENTCQAGKIFLCSKIREQITGKTFYPDILYRHSFKEAQIVTGAKPYVKTDQDEIQEADFYLYDMEAAAVYQAGSYYFGPHQMSFLKIISDNGNAGNVTPAQIECLIGRNMESIADYITSLQAIAHETQLKEIFPEDAVLKEMEKLCIDMHCSKVMSESVRQHIRYCILSGVDYASVLDEMYRIEELPCKDKREGKQCFEKLKERLL